MKLSVTKSLLFFALLFLSLSSQAKNKNFNTSINRKPTSTTRLVEGSINLLNELKNPSVFNSASCAEYINRVTDYMYSLPADFFMPKNQEETDLLKTNGLKILDNIFQMRVLLHEKLQEFDSNSDLPQACVLKIREGFQYARFTEEYILDWLYTNKVVTFSKQPVLVNQQPSTWTNPKFSDFQLRTGDVMLVRGKSFVSAMIARIGDEEGNFSHIAIIGEDNNGKQYVVEAIIQYGTIVTPLEEWRNGEIARVALFRHPDAKLAKDAGKIIFAVANTAIEEKKGIHYDFSMNDEEYSKWFCSETVRYAYDKASKGKLIVPKFKSTLGKFKNAQYPKSLGIDRNSLFAPYDIEVDPRFDFIGEYRFFPLLRQVRMQDAVLQSVYSWMIDKKYSFHWSTKLTVKTYLAKLIRQFGMAKDQLPTYMPNNTLKTTLQFQAVAEALQSNLYKKEKLFKEKNNYLPSFKDMLSINEEYRVADCKLSKEHKVPQQGKDLDLTKFHEFFHADPNLCN